MLYDEFDKFTSEPGESIHSYYLRCAKLINDMNMISMSMTPMQINMKFVNHLQPEWSRFVTVAKQAKDLHSVNFDQLYAFLKHNERDAKEVREMRKRFSDPLTLLANTYNPPPSYNNKQIHYAPPVVQQPPTFQPDTEFVVPTFLPTDDPIASLNKDMIFLSSAYSSRFLPTNNQLRTSSNLRTQAIIQNGRVTVQNVQGRQSQGYAGSAGKNQATGARVGNTVGNAGTNQPRVTRCYNCKGEADSLEETDDCKELQLQATTNFKADHVDAYDSDCDDEATANVIFMASLSPVGSINDDTIELLYDFDILSESYDELTSNENVISYTDYMVTIGNDADNYVHPPVQNNDMILFIGSWEQSDIKGDFKKDVIPFSENLKETFKFFKKGFIAEVKEMKDIFEQMEDEVEQCSVANKCFEIEKK
ncbi:hypothetical protein Tco_0407991 [Tanacetum coccineum]